MPSIQPKDSSYIYGSAKNPSSFTGWIFVSVKRYLREIVQLWNSSTGIDIRNRLAMVSVAAGVVGVQMTSDVAIGWDREYEFVTSVLISLYVATLLELAVRPSVRSNKAAAVLALGYTFARGLGFLHIVVNGRNPEVENLPGLDEPSLLGAVGERWLIILPLSLILHMNWNDGMRIRRSCVEAIRGGL